MLNMFAKKKSTLTANVTTKPKLLMMDRYQSLVTPTCAAKDGTGGSSFRGRAARSSRGSAWKFRLRGRFLPGFTRDFTKESCNLMSIDKVMHLVSESLQFMTFVHLSMVLVNDWLVVKRFAKHVGRTSLHLDIFWCWFGISLRTDSDSSCWASADSDAATEPATSPAAERPPELLEQTWVAYLWIGRIYSKWMVKPVIVTLSSKHAKSGCLNSWRPSYS